MRARGGSFLLWWRADAEEPLGVMAAGTLRGLAVAGGGESSDSEDDGWDIGYLDRSSQVVEKATPPPSAPDVGLPWLLEERPRHTNPLPPPQAQPPPQLSPGLLYVSGC
ncbi:hypothetical protein NN561_011835 [Cricetulus griseus]